MTNQEKTVSWATDREGTARKEWPYTMSKRNKQRHSIPSPSVPAGGGTEKKVPLGTQEAFRPVFERALDFARSSSGHLKYSVTGAPVQWCRIYYFALTVQDLLIDILAAPGIIPS